VPVQRTYLLVHPPLLGPAVWRPVARVLSGQGHVALVPDLRSEVDPPEGWWDRAADAAAATAGDDQVIVVGHSGAGVLLPAIAARLTSVRSVVFVDAVVPAPSGATATSNKLRSFVDDLPVEDGLLPPWSQWWGAGTLAELLPDPAQRELLEAEQPRLARSFYDLAVPVPGAWPDERVGYLRLSPAYDEHAREAAERGWLVEWRNGHHLELVTRPVDVAERIEHLAVIAAG
jgi:hypothetical protein